MDPRSLISRAMDTYRRLTTPDEEGHLPLPAPIRAVGRWVLVFYRELERDRAFQRASALAYGTLVSLVPMLMLMFAVLDATGLLDRDVETVSGLVFGTFLGDIPEVREVLLPGLISINLGAIGAIGTIGWLWVTARIYMTMEEAYSDIFRVPVNRPLGKRLMNFYLALTTFPVVAGLLLFGSIELASRWGIGVWWSEAVRVVVPPLMLIGAIKVLPCTYVRWWPAIIGGTLSGLLIEGGVRGFAVYVKTFAANDPLRVLYGAIGIIPVFLLWIWLLWVFVLLGVEVAHVAQNYRSLVRVEREQRRAQQERLKFPSLETAIEVAAAVAWYFQHGRGPVALEVIAGRCRLPQHRLPPVLEVLEQGGVIAKAANETFMMARPPSDVSLRDVADLWRTHTGLRRHRGDPLSVDLARVTAELLEGSLADAAERWVEPEADPSKAAPAPPPVH